MMIQANEVQIIDKSERSEAWIYRNGRPHVLVLSCTTADRPKMEQVIAELKSTKEPNNTASEEEST